MDFNKLLTSGASAHRRDDQPHDNVNRDDDYAKDFVGLFIPSCSTESSFPDSTFKDHALAKSRSPRRF